MRDYSRPTSKVNDQYCSSAQTPRWFPIPKAEQSLPPSSSTDKSFPTCVCFIDSFFTLWKKE